MRPPHPDDVPYIGVPKGMCLRCGLIGRHPDALACIDALRDLLADRDFELSALRGKRVRRGIQQRRYTSPIARGGRKGQLRP